MVSESESDFISVIGYADDAVIVAVLPAEGDRVQLGEVPRPLSPGAQATADQTRACRQESNAEPRETRPV